MKTFNTVAEMKLAHLKRNTTVLTLGRNFAGDGGGETYLIRSAADFGGTPDGYGNHYVANGNIAVLQCGTILKASSFGAFSGSITNEVEALISRAISDGVASILIDTNDFSVSETLDCHGLHVRGVGQTITAGSFGGASSVEGFIVGGFGTSDRVSVACDVSDDSYKVLLRYGANEYWVLCGEGDSFNQLTFQNNVTETTDSLATTTSDTTTFRFTQQRQLVGVYVAHYASSASSGTWSNQTIANGEVPSLPAFSGGSPVKYRRSPGAAGDYLQYNNCTVVNGIVKITYIASLSACSSVNVVINGVVTGTFDFSGATRDIVDLYFSCNTSTATVKIYANDSSGVVELLGVNFNRLDMCNGSYHTDAYYLRNSALADDLLMASSANDFVVKEADSDTYGCSYHGGETSILDQWSAGKEDISLSIGETVIASKLKLESSCSVDWTGVGGSGSIDIAKTHKFSTDGLTTDFRVSGTVDAVEVYTFMHGSSIDLDIVECPVYKDITSGVDDEANATFGRSNEYKLVDSSTGQSVLFGVTTWDTDISIYGGAWIWKRRFSNPFNKFYYGPIQHGIREWGDIGWRSTYRYTR